MQTYLVWVSVASLVVVFALLAGLMFWYAPAKTKTLSDLPAIPAAAAPAPVASPPPPPVARPPPPPVAAPIKCNPGDIASGTYTRRVAAGTGAGAGWVCPAGYADTGCTWGDKPHEERQCRTAKKKCNPGDTAKGTYTRRVAAGAGWVCPAGYADTGCTWGDKPHEERQCRKF